MILASTLLLAWPALAADREPMGGETAASAAAASTPAAAPSEEAMPAAEPTAAEPTRAPIGSEPMLDPVTSDALARRTFATAIEQREPVDSIDSLGNDHDRVFYFTELVGIEGREVTHRWAYEGRVVAEVPITVGGPRWRAYSSKSLDASWLGEWTVSVVDDSGHVVHTDTFVYEQAAPEPELAAPTSTPDETPTASMPAETQPAAAPAPAPPAPMDR
jgi:hypothetical protein